MSGIVHCIFDDLDIDGKIDMWKLHQTGTLINSLEYQQPNLEIYFPLVVLLQVVQNPKITRLPNLGGLGLDPQLISVPTTTRRPTRKLIGSI